VLQELHYEAIEIADPIAAIPLLASDTRIDLMISDVGMPGMNGRELADVARGHRPDLPILFITGYAEHATLRAEHGRDWRHSAIARAGSLRRQIRRRIRIGQRHFGIASSCSRPATKLRVAFIQTLQILSMDTK
jgi:CheY-like chemotaxis protein